jgi:hypothetical protein
MMVKRESIAIQEMSIEHLQYITDAAINVLNVLHLLQYSARVMRHNILEFGSRIKLQKQVS